MRIKPIIDQIASAHQYAQALDLIAGIAIKPGTPKDVAAVVVAAGRLADDLDAIRRQIAREIATLQGSTPATAGRTDDDVIAMLMQATAPEVQP
jgi:hypothetical protein